MTAEQQGLVVGIAAAAERSGSLESLLKGLSPDLGLAVVLFVDEGEGADDLLDRLSGQSSHMALRIASDGDQLRSGTILVIPRLHAVTMQDQRLHLRPLMPSRRERSLIDLFFSSLAEAVGERTIGIALVPPGADGTLGLKAVKQWGGLTLAEPEGDGDAGPSGEITGGMVDLVLRAAAMPAALEDYARSFGILGRVAEIDGQHRDQRLERLRLAICGVLRDRVGHDFSGYKPKTFFRRVQRRMQILQINDPDLYLRHLEQEAAEAITLFRDLLIGVTSFFRDADAFSILARDVVPRLFEEKGAKDTVRIWVPACATGEEVYSIAILLAEQMEQLERVPRVQIFATDIDEPALETARTARYPATVLQDVSPERLKRFFVQDGDSYTVRKEIRDFCIFSTHSVVRDPPFSRIDFISCRNLLIYLGAHLQSQVIPVFHYALRPGGYLFLGVAENTSNHHELFLPIDKRFRIFRRRDMVDSSVPLPFIFAGGGPTALGPALTSGTPQGARSLRDALEQRVLERHAPAHVLVNHDGDVVYYSPRTGKYLEPAAGPPSRQLLALARKGLRLDLRNALQEAIRTRQPVRRENLNVELDDRQQAVDLLVEPFEAQHENEPLLIVLFTDAGPLRAKDSEETAQAAADGVEHLERELRDTRERLQATIEEYETAIEELRSANEELVSVNEELQSTNEELETSKEEMQSLNVELQTVNAELNRNLVQLDQASADLKNLFDSTNIASIFLDRDLRIRSFTAAAADIFNVIPSDRGRPLTDIVHNLDYAELEDDLRAVATARGSVERHVDRRPQGTSYLMRMLPYRGNDERIDGVLITFVDITTIKRAEDHQQRLIDELNHRVRNMLTVVLGLAAQTLGGVENDQAVRRFVDRLMAMSRAYNLLTEVRWADVPLSHVLREELAPYQQEADRFELEGPAVELWPRAALSLGMTVHELTTNAAKYGSLSVPGGRVSVTWTIERDEAVPQIVLEWRESGGPAVVEPSRKGFGSSLIRQQLAYELGGEVSVDYRPDGLHAIMRIPLIRPAGGPASPGDATPAPA